MATSRWLAAIAAPILAAALVTSCTALLGEQDVPSYDGSDGSPITQGDATAPSSSGDGGGDATIGTDGASGGPGPSDGAATADDARIDGTLPRDAGSDVGHEADARVDATLPADGGGDGAAGSDARGDGSGPIDAGGVADADASLGDGATAEDAAACGLSTCATGCCSADGGCVTAVSNASCGTGGALCGACSGNSRCLVGIGCGCASATDCPPNQACNVATGACTTTCGVSQLCNGGCCDPNTETCVVGNSRLDCGGTGGACVTCSPSVSGGVCLGSFVCGCTTQTDCPSGHACRNNVCTTTCTGGLTCNGGCCDGTTCQPASNACGGCGAISGGTPDAGCGTCGTLTCSGGNAVTCADPGKNECGGCTILPGAVGDPCLACGTWVCSGALLRCNQPKPCP